MKEFLKEFREFFEPGFLGFMAGLMLLVLGACLTLGLLAGMAILLWPK